MASTQLVSNMKSSRFVRKKEIEDALSQNQIDLAVHSMKDVSVHVPDGLDYAAILMREDPRDALLSPIAPTL